jgi:protein-S-isoprenylcysteine O-methyltransferase Ste14
MLWIRTLPSVTIFAWPGYWTWVRWLGVAGAMLLFWLGTRSYDTRSFLGVAQVLDYVQGNPTREPPFRSTGILAFMRHPWYTGTIILLIFCLPFTDVNLVWRLVFLVYTLIGTELEERKLRRDLGAAYAAYHRRVPRFLPGPRTLRRRGSGPGKGS